MVFCFIDRVLFGVLRKTRKFLLLLIDPSRPKASFYSGRVTMKLNLRSLAINENYFMPFYDNSPTHTSKMN
jgi:hypothetical protein